MRKKMLIVAVSAFLIQAVFPGASFRARAQAEKSPYAVAAPIDQYLIADKDAEIALARSAAPASISDAAEVLVLGHDGYTTAVKGSNGFVCLVDRGWAASTDFPEFWNPKIRGPICINATATRSYLPAVRMKAKLVLAGKSKAEIAQAIESAFSTKELSPVEPGGMCYMMSKQQYLGDQGMNWHPHLMWFVPGGDAAKSWGADLEGSPVMAFPDPEDRMTIFLVWAGHWSDGTPAPGH